MSVLGANAFPLKEQLSDLVFFSNTELSKIVRFFYELKGQWNLLPFAFNILGYIFVFEMRPHNTEREKRRSSNLTRTSLNSIFDYLMCYAHKYVLRFIGQNS